MLQLANARLRARSFCSSPPASFAGPPLVSRPLPRQPHPDAFEELFVEVDRLIRTRAFPPAVGQRLTGVHHFLALLAPPMDDEFPFVGYPDFIDPRRRGPTSAPK